MKEILKAIPPLSLLVIYMFLCGGLYFLGYWKEFHFDAIEFIQVWDIPKNFFFPFSLAAGVSLVFLALKRFSNESRRDEETSKKFYLTPKNLWFIFLVIGACLFPVFVNNSTYIYIVVVIMSWNITYMIDEMPLFVTTIPNYYNRQVFALLVILIPFLSLTHGKIKARDVHYNRDIKYINIIKKDTAITNLDTVSYKLLGFLGDKIIGSTLDNDKIIVLNQSDFKGVILSETKPVIEKKIEPKVDTAQNKLKP